MDKWQDEKEFLSLPLYWHGEDDDDEGSDDPANDDSTGDEGNTGSGEGKDGKDKQDGKTTPSTKPKTGDDAGDDDVSDDIPENLEGLSAEELRQFIKLQGKELKKTKEISRKRLHEIMDKKEKFKEMEQKKEDERRKELEEKQQYKTLYEEMKPKFDLLVKDVSKTHTHLETRFEKLKEGLPEEYHNLIPEVDIRDKIAWIENFNNTVVAKTKTVVADQNKTTTTDGGEGVKNKSTTSVGNTTQPHNDSKTKKDDQSTIESMILNTGNAEELEALLAGLAKKGITG